MRFSDEAIETLKHYSWPGNVRELANVIAFTAAMTENELIEIADLPPRLRDFARLGRGSNSQAQTERAGGTFYDQVAAFEKKLLSDAYPASEGNISKLALALGMDRSHLYTKLKEYGLHSAKKK
jgi:two-component system nitrogen regulation response regulator NtrX